MLGFLLISMKTENKITQPIDVENANIPGLHDPYSKQIIVSLDLFSIGIG